MKNADCGGGDALGSMPRLMAGATGVPPRVRAVTGCSVITPGISTSASSRNSFVELGHWVPFCKSTTQFAFKFYIIRTYRQAHWHSVQFDLVCGCTIVLPH